LDLDTALLILRVFAGLVIAGHGAQKAFGWSGGPGIESFSGMVRGMGFRPERQWAYVAAYAELGGGLLLAAGLLTGLAAGLLVVDMIVAMWKVHWSKGFWITKGGYEHALTYAVIFGLFGLAGAGEYSVDASLGLVSWTTILFLVTVVLGLTGIWSATRPTSVERLEEERRRRAA
jgi:putative oxidoreductase